MTINDTTQSILWWGRSDHEYNRNRVIRQSLNRLGYHIIDFRPSVSRWGHLEFAFKGRRFFSKDALASTKVVWVPNFRQRDLAAGQIAAKRLGLPLIFDPLISAYDKQVYEREKFSADSKQARQLKVWETRLFQSCDQLIADTEPHADYFAEEFNLDRPNIHVIPVGTDENMFHTTPLPSIHSPAPAPRPHILFYGSFLRLHGIETIIAAAKQIPEADWFLLGDGPHRQTCIDLALDQQHIRFENPIPFPQLPDRIARADILLGVFGTSDKATRVIPNKLYQSLASGRLVVTQTSPAYPEPLRKTRIEQSGIGLIRHGDLDHFVMTVRHQLDQAKHNPLHFSTLGESARATYEYYFGSDKIDEAVNTALQKAIA